jgi:hypothetical protein
MRISELLLEKINNVKNHVDRDDLVAILDALKLNKSQISGASHCFITAIAAALTIMSGKAITGEDVRVMIGKGGGYDVHPADIQGAKKYKKNIVGSPTREIHLSVSLVKSVEEIKKWLKQKVPVILSVRFNQAYYRPVKHLRDNSDVALDAYRSEGASEEMVEKVKNGIIPYPDAQWFDKKHDKEYLTHAILCYGYDSSEKAFICKDFGWSESTSKYKASFKIEEKAFFDKKLQQTNDSIVEAAVAIEIEDDKKIEIDEKTKKKLELVNKIKKIAKKYKGDVRDLDLASFVRSLVSFERRDQYIEDVAAMLKKDYGYPREGSDILYSSTISDLFRRLF